MNMIYKDDVLYIDLDKVSKREINNLKRRIFNIINQYSINNIIINTSSSVTDNHYLLNKFIEEYKSSYSGNITINNI